MSYQWVTEANNLTVQWTSDSLLVTGRVLGVALAGAGAWLLSLGIRKETLRPFWLAAGGIAFAAGALLFAGTFIKPPSQRWNVDAAGVRVTSPESTALVPWEELQTVRVDRQSGKLDRASLVLKDKAGKETWLVMSWLIPQHRRKMIDILNRHAPRAMAPVLSDEAYLKALREKN